MILAEYDVAASDAFWFLGLSDEASEGQFVWTDGTEPAYTNWFSGEPNDGGDGEDCTAVRPLSGYGYQWIDMSCDTEADYLCEAG